MMNGLLRFAATLILFFCIPYLFRVIIISNVTRSRFALFSSFIVGTLFFLLSIMYLSEDSLIIGAIMFLFALAGGFPTLYLLYPILKSQIKKAKDERPGT